MPLLLLAGCGDDDGEDRAATDLELRPLVKHLPDASCAAGDTETSTDPDADLTVRLDDACAVVGPNQLAPGGVRSARAVRDDVGGEWIIVVDLTEAGTRDFRSIVVQHVGDQVAVVMGTRALSAPTIQDDLLGADLEEIVITGDFSSEAEARALATSIAE